jgi:hypothetical protein
MTEGRTIAISPQALAALMVEQIADGDSVEQAVREGRCLKPQMGCGQKIPLTQDREGRRMPSYAFPHPDYKEEWKRTGLCPSCFDRASLKEDGDTIVRGLD